MDYQQIISIIEGELHKAESRAESTMATVKMHYNSVKDKDSYLDGELLKIDYSCSVLGFYYLNGFIQKNASLDDIKGLMAQCYLKHNLFVGLPEEEKEKAIREDSFNFLYELRKEYYLHKVRQDKRAMPKIPKGMETYFAKAIAVKLMEDNTLGYKWNDTKVLLAYFAEKLSLKFDLSRKIDQNGEKTIAWKFFETLFNTSGLKNAKQNWMRLNTRFEPIGYERINAMF